MKHKFYDCPTVKVIWYGVKNLLGLQNNFSFTNVVLGTKLSNEKKTRQINVITMLTNQFIWKEKSRSQNFKLSYINLKKYIRRYLEIEKYIANISDKEHNFKEVWGDIYEKIKQ